MYIGSFPLHSDVMTFRCLCHKTYDMQNFTDFVADIDGQYLPGSMGVKIPGYQPGANGGYALWMNDEAITRAGDIIELAIEDPFFYLSP